MSRWRLGGTASRIGFLTVAQRLMARLFQCDGWASVAEADCSVTANGGFGRRSLIAETGQGTMTLAAALQATAVRMRDDGMLQSGSHW